MTELLNQIKIGLKRDDDTEISCPLFQSDSTISDKNLIQCEIPAKIVQKELQQNKLDLQGNNQILNDVVTTQQKHSQQISSSKKALTTITLEEQGEIGGMAERTSPAIAISAQQNTTTEDQRAISYLASQMDVVNEIKAATSILNAKNGYVAAVQKDQENTLKQNDVWQIQNIQRDLQCYPLIHITGYVEDKDEPPFHVFPPLWSGFLKSIACSLNIQEDALISGFLASVFIATRGKFHIEVKENYFEALTEYFIVALPSGSKKSGIVQTFKSIMDSYLERLQAEFDKSAPKQELIIEIYERTKKKLLTDLTKAEVVSGHNHRIFYKLEEIEKDLMPLKDQIAKFYSRPNLFNDSPTMKKLAKNMKAQGEVISIFDAEAGIWKERVRAKEDVILLKAYTMESFGNETVTNGSVTMQAPCLTICSYIQPEVAFNLYSKEDLKDDGLLPRILPFFSLSRHSLHETVPQDINPELMSMYEEKITKILNYTCGEGWNSKDSSCRRIETLKLDEAARQGLHAFSHLISKQIHTGKFKGCEAFASKLAGHAVRLAGAVHFLQHEEPWEKPINASAMKAGIALSEFYAQHAIFAFDRRENDSVIFARKIIKWIKRHRKSTFEARDAQRGVGHCKVTQIETGIDLLMKKKYLARYFNYKGKLIYIVNPNTFREEN